MMHFWFAPATRLLLMLTVTLICMPLAPLMPEWGLDASFALAVGQAQADGLVFGRDVIFTLGPYAPLYTALYQPSTDTLMLAASALLAGGYVIALWQLRPKGWTALVAVALLASLFSSRDALLLCYPLIALLALIQGKRGALLLGVPFGLLLLTKGSLLPLCVLALTSGIFVLWRQGERWRALHFLAGAVLAIPLLWVLAGQPLAALGNYWVNQLPLISGFGEAMSTSGPLWQIMLWLSVALVAALCLSLQPWNTSGRWLWLLNLSALLFVAFKAGFVRHDMHVLIASNSLLLVACVLLGWGRRALSCVALLAALLGWQQLDVMYPYPDRPALQTRAWHFFSNSAAALYSRITEPQRLEQRYSAALASLQQRYQFPAFQGAVDIYSANQAELLASGNRWQPRPIFQSYTAYTPGLLAINRAHVLSQTAAQHILFKVEPIDGRLPALEEGNSWPALLEHYRLDQQADNGYLYLSRRSNASSAAPASVPGSHIRGQMGQAIILPEPEQPSMASFRLHKTLYGRVMSLLYKTEPLRIGLELADGRHLDFRFIPGMASEPFLFSPAVLDTADFASLSQGDKRMQTGNAVVALNLYCPQGCQSWVAEYELQLQPATW